MVAIRKAALLPTGRRGLMVGLSLIASVFSHPEALSAQERILAIDAALNGRIVNMEVTSRKVDRETYLADLEAQGLVLPELPQPSSTAHFLTQEELGVARRTAVLEYAKTLPDHELVEVYVAFTDIPWKERFEFRSMSDEEKEQALSQRNDVVRLAQRDFVEHAKNLGAQGLNPSVILNDLRVLLPARRVAQILDHPDVHDVYPAWEPVESSYDMQEIREQTFLQEFRDANFLGNTGGRHGSRVKIAIIEGPFTPTSTRLGYNENAAPNLINDLHRNWTDPFTNESRIEQRLDCAVITPPAPCYEPPSKSYASHATAVAGIAAGSIDPFPGQKRSGIVPLASILFFRTQTMGQVKFALQQAALAGADVANLS